MKQAFIVTGTSFSHDIFKGTGKIIEVEGGNDDNGHEIQQWKFLDYNYQSWKFVKVADCLSAVLEDETSARAVNAKGRYRFTQSC